MPPGLAASADAAARGLAAALGGRPEPSRGCAFDAADGERIEADVFEPPERAPVAKLLVGPAMGVRRQFYAPFAADMAAHGVATMTFDYRGVGGSRRGPVGASEARLSQWGEQDMAAATLALRRLGGEGGAGAPLLFVGHSVGGQLFGLMAEMPYRAALLVGSQSGHWRHWDGADRAAMAAFWYLGVPALTGALGYLPMRAFGQGEDIPKGVAREWARWSRDRSYVGVRLAERPDAGFNHWGGRLRAVAIADDRYAPPRAVAALAGLYRAAEREVVTLRPDDVGARAIGHFGWFRRHVRDTLWADARRWLLAAAGVAAPD